MLAVLASRYLKLILKISKQIRMLQRTNLTEKYFQ